MTGTVTEQGITLASPGVEPLVLSLDGRYVWSFSPGRDGVPARGGTFVAWPDQLRRFLRGTAVVRVSDVPGTRVLLEDEVTLGGAPGRRIGVVDPQGLPLAIDKVGHLCRAFSATEDAVRDEILAGTRRALDDLTEGCGVRAYLNYGALLGAVRDGAMIAHDSDTDVCYLSEAASPAELILESYRIERTLRERGWNVLRMSGGDVKLLLPLSDGRQCHIDVFVAFRVAGTFYQLGNRSGRLPESAILPLSTITLHGHEFPAPADPEAMLAFVYGAGWRVPDPSFRYADPVAGVRRLDGWLRGYRTDMGRWTEFYRSPDAKRISQSGSAFARWAHQQVRSTGAIADLGCGNGRDAVYFAKRGRPVVAYEFSRAARGTARRRIASKGHGIDVRLLVLGELRSVLLAGAELARTRHHLYARQLLGCLDAQARANLWLLSRMALRHGGSLLLEFSAATGEQDPGQDPGPAGLVRRLDVDAVRREIEAAGGVIAREELAEGVDMLGDPDPLVCRMRVLWPRPTPSNPRRTG
ncbi:SAM-dependent methyltransferase [Nocardioides ginsengisegetis]|uniref:SAM-dependent methyltransferase n=1 Tax=Nocardioides ginsengisegetis TaxID=661491 RepID=A0A7W3PAJ4_9ACTN|nr:class I SAM-dependent methyltransferase [Nocardioides ginsengisegetis]MBA8804673.1 SAM-dependent methyltransferase [Nocardioides ginsengisegetis]